MSRRTRRLATHLYDFMTIANSSLSTAQQCASFMSSAESSNLQHASEDNDRSRKLGREPGAEELLSLTTARRSYIPIWL